MSLSIIPSDLNNLTQGEKRIANKIKELYSEKNQECFLYVQPRIRNLEPDFILIDPIKGICIIEVKDWDSGFIKEINRTKVVSSTGKTFYNPVFRANQYFNLAKGLFESDERLFDQDGFASYNLYSKVIFTNLPQEGTERFKIVLNQHPSKYITSDKIRNLSIEQLFDYETCNLTSTQLLVLRGILFPEIKIIDNIDLELAISDYEVEDYYATIKALDSEQEQFSKRIPNGHYIVSGIPGSGKTVILISRAIYLLKKNPNWKIKIVTYNRSLSRKIEYRINSLSDDLAFMGVNLDNISISTFHRLALDIAAGGVPQNADNYFWNHKLPIEAMKKAVPMYDAVLIDEYQDFYDDWIKLCIKIAKSQEINGKITQNLFLAGDRLQSIYNPNEHTWSSIGIHIRGRSKLLKHTYRAGKSHIELALKMLLSDPKLKKEVNKFYEGIDDIEANENIDEQVEFIEGNYNEVSSLLHNLINIVGYKQDEILILSPNWDDANKFYSMLSPELKQISKVTRDVIDNKLIITTYHSSKGLESRICILLNIDQIEELKLLYVGMTRASQQLYIHSMNFEYSEIATKIRNGDFSDSQLNEIEFDEPEDLPF